MSGSTFATWVFMSSIEHGRFDKLRAVLLLIALAGSVFVHFRFRVPLGFSLMIFFVGWPIGGTLVTIDDDLKGGWSNPDGTVRRRGLRLLFGVRSRAAWLSPLADSLSTLVGGLQTAPDSGARPLRQAS